MSEKHTRLAIAFIDICGSTKMYEKYGDVEALKIISQWMSDMSDIVEEYKGKVLRTIGDELFCTFPTSEQAIMAARVMQNTVHEDEHLADYNITMRAGINYGEVLFEKKEVYGDAVNLAARLASIAKADQIITSAATINELPQFLKTKSRRLGMVQVKGKKESIEIFQLLWQEDEDDLTAVKEPDSAPGTMTSISMILRYRDKTLTLSAKNTPFTLGRGNQNDLEIDEKMASRNHASIDYRHGRFILTDFSTNGTFVRMYDGQKFDVHRDEIHLHNKGFISLGRAISGDTSTFISFTNIVGVAKGGG